MKHREIVRYVRDKETKLEIELCESGGVNLAAFGPNYHAEAPKFIRPPSEVHVYLSLAQARHLASLLSECDLGPLEPPVLEIDAAGAATRAS